MADLGNIGWSVAPPAAAFALDQGWPAAGSDYSMMAACQPPALFARNFTLSRMRSGNTVIIPSTNLVTLTVKGVYVGSSKGAAGAYFYDLDDDVYYAHESEGAGAWKVEVQGATVTITPLSAAASATHAYASVLT